MFLSTRILGASVVTKLAERGRTPVLTIGSDRFGRGDLAAVACFNFAAAANLSRILNHEFAVRNTREVFDKIDPIALALPRLGAVSLAVLGAAFEAKGLGGDAPLESWVAKHSVRNGSTREFVTFDTIKHHKEHDDEARRRTDRKHARRNQAHESRVSRFNKRRGGES